MALRKTVQGESQKLNNLRCQNRQMLMEEKEKESAFKTLTDECKEIHEKFNKFKEAKADAQERLRQIEEMLENESKNTKQIEDETARLSSVFYRSEQQLKKLQEFERNLIIERQGLESNILRIRSMNKNLEKELLRQTEILYNIEYKIQHAEMRLANMQGTIDEEEMVRLDTRRQHLITILDDKTKASDIMSAQIARTEEDMKKLSTNFQNSIQEYEKIVSILSFYHKNKFLMISFPKMCRTKNLKRRKFTLRVMRNSIKIYCIRTKRSSLSKTY